MSVSLDSFKEWYNDPSSLTAEISTPADSVMEALLNASESIIKDMLGLRESEDIPDNDRVDSAIYLLAQFFCENRSSQEKVLKAELHPISEQKTYYYRRLVAEAVYKQIVNMIAKYRKPERFIVLPDENKWG